MPDSLVQLQQIFSVEALEKQLFLSSTKAQAVFQKDPEAYAKRMEDVRDIIGQLAMALEIEDQARIRAMASIEHPVMTAHLN